MKKRVIKKLKYKLEIEIWGIEVEETEHYIEGHGRGWYKFEYSAKTNGGKKHLGEIDGRWSNQTKRSIIKKLKNGYASELVYQKII